MKSHLLDTTGSLSLCFLVCLSSMAQSLQITSLADGTVVKPGQTLSDTVVATGSFSDVVVMGNQGTEHPFSNKGSAQLAITVRCFAPNDRSDTRPQNGSCKGTLVPIFEPWAEGQTPLLS